MLTCASLLQGATTPLTNNSVSSSSNTAAAQQWHLENSIRHQLSRLMQTPSTQLMAFGSYCDYYHAIAVQDCGSAGIASWSCSETSGTTGSYSYSCRTASGGGGGPAPIQSWFSNKFFLSDRLLGWLAEQPIFLLSLNLFNLKDAWLRLPGQYRKEHL